MDDETQAHVIFSGRVQGVFFRSFTEETACGLGLKGWVRNLSEGSVEAVFEGDRDRIAEAIKKCSKGPPDAYVDNVDTRWGKARGEFSSFSVRYY
ncbi:MAG TPA: acylphosphatase [Nitrospirae bacterium]|nr:acylphosphatase [Nitrospirota bacterium]